MSESSFLIKVWRHGGVVFYNIVGMHAPTHTLRIGLLRLFGARIAAGVAIASGTTVLGIEHLEIGARTRIGFRCLLDARGGLTIGADVEISDDVQFITAHHDPQSDDFRAETAPIVVEHHVWIGSLATVLDGLTIGAGAIVGACSVVRASVPAASIAVGIPTHSIGQRRARLDYQLDARKVRA